MVLLVENYKDYCDWLLVDFVVFAKAKGKIVIYRHLHTYDLRGKTAAQLGQNSHLHHFRVRMALPLILQKNIINIVKCYIEIISEK